MAFEPLRRRRNLTVRGRGPLPIHGCTSTSGSLCTRNALGCDTSPMTQVAGANAFVPPPPGRTVPRGRLRPLTGATHVFGIPHTPRRPLGCARPSHPSPRVARSSSPMREGHGRVPRRLLGHAVPPDGPPVGERVLRRLGAARNGLPARMIRWGATPEGSGDERVKTRTAPRPNRAPVPLGSLPTKPQAAPAPRPPARRSRKTFPRQRISRTGGAHHRSAKMCIDPRCLLHTSGTAQRIRTPTRFEPPPAGPNSMS